MDINRKRWEDNRMIQDCDTCKFSKVHVVQGPCKCCFFSPYTSFTTISRWQPEKEEEEK